MLAIVLYRDNSAHAFALNHDFAIVLLAVCSIDEFIEVTYIVDFLQDRNFFLPCRYSYCTVVA